ncbi:hypothetical protein OKA06_15085 [Novosphingobium sp. MW5]|nr:hypothetical protein [Novosphingobium sp. MW5]
MESITIDGLHEDAFRQSIEDMLRRGYADDAAAKLRALLQPFTGEGAPFPARFMDVSHQDIEISGWEALDEGLKKFDRAEQLVTAICLSFGDPEGRAPVPDGAGLMSLTVETAYFSDEAFPFSESDRNDLLDGYSSFGCQWAGDCEGVDHAIAFRGVDDLYGALAGLEQRLLSAPQPDPEEIRAGTIASCYLSVLFHKALRESFAKRRLGRPLCVLTANNGVYPSFDAPVLSCDEYLAGGEVVPVPAAAPVEIVSEDSFAPAHAAMDDEEGSEEASLLSIGIKRSSKKLALALAEGDDDHSIDAMANAALGGVLPPLPVEPAPVAADPFDYRPYLEQAEAQPPVEDVFEDPASFVELPVEPAPQVEPDEPAPAAELPPAEPEPEAEPVATVEPINQEAPERTPFVSPEPEIWIEPAKSSPTEAYQPLPVVPDSERELGDTIWPEREENPAVQAEDIAPFEPAAPPSAPAARREFPQQAGHSLRARISGGSDEGPASKPATESLLAKLIGTIRGLFRR